MKSTMSPLTTRRQGRPVDARSRVRVVREEGSTAPARALAMQALVLLTPCGPPGHRGFRPSPRCRSEMMSRFFRLRRRSAVASAIMAVPCSCAGRKACFSTPEITDHQIAPFDDFFRVQHSQSKFVLPTRLSSQSVTRGDALARDGDSIGPSAGAKGIYAISNTAALARRGPQVICETRREGMFSTRNADEPFLFTARCSLIALARLRHVRLRPLTPLLCSRHGRLGRPAT